MNKIPTFSLSDPDIEADTPVVGETTFTYTMTPDPDPPGIWQQPALVQFSPFNPIHDVFTTELINEFLVDHTADAGTTLFVKNNKYAIGTPNTFTSQAIEIVNFLLNGVLYTGFLSPSENPNDPFKITFITPTLDGGIVEDDQVRMFDAGRFWPMNVPCWFDPDFEVGFNGDPLYEGTDPGTFERIVEHHIVKGFPRLVEGGSGNLVTMAPTLLELPPGGMPEKLLQTSWNNGAAEITKAAIMPYGDAMLVLSRQIHGGGWYIWADDGPMEDLSGEKIQRLRVPAPLVLPAGGNPPCFEDGEIANVESGGPSNIYSPIGASYLAPYFRVLRRSADFAGKDFPGWGIRYP